MVIINLILPPSVGVINLAVYYLNYYMMRTKFQTLRLLYNFYNNYLKEYDKECSDVKLSNRSYRNLALFLHRFWEIFNQTNCEIFLPIVIKRFFRIFQF